MCISVIKKLSRKDSAKKPKYNPPVENQERGKKEKARNEHAEFSEFLLNKQNKQEGSTAKCLRNYY